ncbi:MAG: YceK/YidQ family lipoprotein [Gammaproteobacteria bacterium]|nr:YceK/YidQ family lipoprotein [Gammaproteobacteria bacterium]
MPRIYSGTIFDSRCIYHPDKAGANNMELFCLIDLPLSILLDTLILPYTIYTQIRYGSYGIECSESM